MRDLAVRVAEFEIGKWPDLYYTALRAGSAGIHKAKSSPFGAARHLLARVQYVNIRSCSRDRRSRTLGIASSPGLPSRSAALTPRALEDMPDR